MAGDDDDRLSDLPDDLLRRILHFVPAREAASTSLLSRRWGSLWRSSGAVNLVEHVEDEDEEDEEDEEEEEEDDDDDDDDVLTPKTAERSSSRRRDAFLRAAGAALTAADGCDSSCGHVTRLAVDVHAPNGCWIGNFLNGDKAAADDDMDVLHAVVSHPAARRVEELRLRVASDNYDIDRAMEEPRWNRGVYGLNLASLPFEMLRVLDIAGCNNLSLPPAAAAAVAFPRLQTLRLRQCASKLTHLQRLIDAAPGLATVHFESVVFDDDDDNNSNHPSHYHYGGDTDDADTAQAHVRLRCPAATSLVLELCGSSQYDYYGDGSGGGIAIDAPKLRSFRYKGLARRLYLRSPAPEMTAASLHFIHVYQLKEDTARALFWRFVGNFTNAKTLRLKIHNVDHLAVAGNASRAELLSVFSNLERLELQTKEQPTTKKAAVAIANLLHCCPALLELTMKLNTTWTVPYWPNPNDKSCCHGRFQPDFDESVDHFIRRKSNTTKAGSLINRKRNGDRHVDEVPDIPALSRRSFTCLQRSLRKVSLKFKWRWYDCFGVQLVKFFAQNAMVLEEMWIDSGDRKLCDHMNVNVERWVGVDSSKISLKHKNSEDSTWEFLRICPDSTPEELETSTTSFIVLPLKR